jgi:hypothetical protein
LNLQQHRTPIIISIESAAAAAAASSNHIISSSIESTSSAAATASNHINMESVAALNTHQHTIRSSIESHQHQIHSILSSEASHHISSSNIKFTAAFAIHHGFPICKNLYQWPQQTCKRWTIGTPPSMIHDPYKHKTVSQPKLQHHINPY